jgi:hypothetical protein
VDSDRVKLLYSQKHTVTEEGAIAIIIPSAMGITNDPTATTAQDVEINVIINLSLRKHYQDNCFEQDY